METLSSYAVIGIALCAAVIVWALRMARSHLGAEREGLGSQEPSVSDGDGPDLPASPPTPAQSPPETAAQDEGPARYYVKRRAAASTPEPELEETAGTRFSEQPVAAKPDELDPSL